MRLFVWVCALVLGGGGLLYGALRWLNAAAEEAARPQTPQRQAQLLAESRGCVACHSLDGRPGVGPSWAGIWGARRRFADGSSAVVDTAYLREAMLEPAARVVEGYDKVMLPAGFTEAEVALMTDFIRSLSPVGNNAD